MYYDINFKVPFNYQEEIQTNNEQKTYSIKIFENKIDLLHKKIEFESFKKSTSRKQIMLNSDYPLPIIIFTDTYKEITYQENTRSIEEAKELSEKIVFGRIVRELNIESDVLDEEYNYIEESDGLIVNAVVTTIERIDEQIEISQSEIDALEEVIENEEDLESN